MVKDVPRYLSNISASRTTDMVEQCTSAQLKWGFRIKHYASEWRYCLVHFPELKLVSDIYVYLFSVFESMDSTKDTI